MKRTHFVSSCALIILFATACQTAELDIRTESPAVAEPCEISCSMSATMPEFKVGGDPETKSSLESVVRVKWKKNDELSVINLTTGKQLGGCIKADNDGANSTFSPSGLHGTITAGDKLVFLLDNDPGRRSATEKDFEPFTMDYSSQKGNSNEVPIVVYADYTATENGTINAVNPEFNFLMGYVQLAVSALPASTSVTELGIENLNTRCQFSISNHEFVTTPQNGNITLSEAFTANSKGTNTRYFSCFTSPAQGVARNAHIHANSVNHITAWLKAALSAGYYYQSVATGFTNENISFVDDTFKSYCVSHYDKNGDGEVSFAEAAAVTSFESFSAAEKSSLKEVYELPYFFKGERIPDFEGCTALQQIILPGTLQTIQANAFKGCTALEEITIPSNVSTIGEGAFEGCTALERFNGPLSSADRRYLVKNNRVLAFAPAGLTETTIPAGVTTINTGVFANNTTILTVNLSAELATVEARAFKGCTALPIIRFHSQIASIGEEAFKGCSALRSIYSDAVTPPTVSTDAFANCHASLAAHVTASNLAAYESDPFWSTIGVSSAQPWNEIWYTSTDNNVVPYHSSFLSNTYEDGKGIIVLDSDLTTIPENAFYFESRLLTISLPDCVSVIDNYAFHLCSGLTSLEYNGNLTSLGEAAFAGCSNLTSLSLSSSLAIIPRSAFAECSNLSSVNLGNAVVTIGATAFSNCTALTTLDLGNNVTTLGSNAFWYCTSLASLNIGQQITEIPQYAFYYCSSLTSLNLGNNITTIGENAFSGCQELASLNVGQNIQTVGMGAFDRCASLTSLDLGNDVISIGGFAFYYCDKLASLNIGKNITSIPDGAFQGCGTLKALDFGNNVTSVGESAFAGCVSLASLNLGNKVTSIGKTAFSSCWVLESLTFGDNVEFVGKMAFDGASKILSLTFNKVTNIESYAFHGAQTTTLVFGDCVESIGYYALEQSHIRYLYIKTTTPPTIGDSENNRLFNNIPADLVIYVPTESVNAYKAANGWSLLADKITGYVF